MGNCLWRSRGRILEACLRASGIHGSHMKSARYLGLCVLRFGLLLPLLFVVMISSWLELLSDVVICVISGTPVCVLLSSTWFFFRQKYINILLCK